ncbi:MAG: IS701 family transposase [Nitrospirota bacterium]|nr:IS701 family transposase [Nitrospirota bacterium]
MQQVVRWGQQLDALGGRIGAFIAHAAPRRRVTAYLRAVVGGVDRRNGWQLAEQAGEATPYGMQRLMASASWDAERVRDDLRAYVVEHLGDPAGVLVIDETGFLKKGTKSAGVQRQYSGTAGRIENCQIGVFLSYATPRGYAFLDRALYVPKSWCEDRARCRTAGIPDTVPFCTKPALARAMLARALDAEVPAAWVTGDEVYGNDRALRQMLEQRAQPFVLAIKVNALLWTPEESHAQRAGTIAAALPPTAWQVLRVGSGSKGPRAYRWAWTELTRLGEVPGQHALLVREALTANTRGTVDRAYYLVFAPARTTLAAVAQVAGTRWTIEQGFEAAKQEVGLDEYEVRKYDGWYRYITLALFAHAFLTVVRAQATPGKKGRRAGRPTRGRSSR